MIQVEAELRFWTPDGMQTRPRMGGSHVAYIEAREVELLLEDAYRRGAADVKARMSEVLAEAVIGVTGKHL